MNAYSQSVPLNKISKQRKWSDQYDMLLIIAMLFILLTGLIMVASSSVAIAERLTGNPLYYFQKQLVYVLIGLILATAALFISVETWLNTSVALLFFSVLLLVLVLIPGIGREVNGSMRWISIGFANLQPSELVKIFMPMFIAGYLVRQGREVRETFSGFIKPIIILLFIASLLLLEPDYGATVVLFATVLGMMFLGGVNMSRFLVWMFAAIGLMGAIVMLAPYRVKRLTTFLDPWADPFDSGFQLTQALIAVGRGEWFGTGLGNSIQKLFYLPEAHTDFLFAVLGEELGFAGMALIILTFLFMVSRIFDIAHRALLADKQFDAYYSYGAGLYLGMQAFINIGVNLGLLPTKGLTLPLMSYGGSSMIANCLAIGIVLRVDHELRIMEKSR